MKQVLIQLDDRTAVQLERVAPARSHKRSDFVRRAIAHALEAELEVRTRAAYEKWPDEPPPFDPAEWAPEAEVLRPPKPRVRRRRRGRASGRP
jgi:hypothetical protein